MNKVTINKDICKGCGLCVSVCPRHILELSKDTINRKGHYPVEMKDQSQCIGCAFCATMCPDCVITVERG